MGFEYSTGSTSDAISPVYGDDLKFCYNTVNTTEPYVPEFMSGYDNATWYPDFGATHHVCKEATRLQTAAPYSSMDPLLMSDGSCAKVAGICNSTKTRSNRSLHLSNFCMFRLFVRI